ncbi:MAG: hypothetical protein RLZZ157_1207, partial [Pseudomonadota bacterium]
SQFSGGVRVTIHAHEGDLPDGLDLGPIVAVDTETLGLSLVRDALCVVQLSDGSGDAHVVRLIRPAYDCPNLKALLTNPKVEKIFHFARFDVAMCKAHLDIDVAPIFCTKIASKLARTYTDRHGLKDVVRELVGIDLNKQQQSSDWGAPALSEAQLHYAASDVLYLHGARTKLIEILTREGRMDLAQTCFDFLPTRAQLDLLGWPEIDIFSHS